jgi:DNA polymerase
MPIKKLHIDIETYSSVDITTCGAYKYMESLDFEIMIIAYCFDDGPIEVIDLAQGDKMPPEFLAALSNKDIEKHAHNANFERNAFRAYGYDIPAAEWRCSAILAGYCGIPLSLDGASKALALGELGKSASGKALIRFFSCPVKATKVNGGRLRNLPGHDIEKWEQFKDYCIQDVKAERAIGHKLAAYSVPPMERNIYNLDQKINDRGIEVDLHLAASAVKIDALFSQELTLRAKEVTKLDNPNSPAQLKVWLSNKLQREVKTLAKDSLVELVRDTRDGEVLEILDIRKKAAKTSTKKYDAMLKVSGEDRRARGLFQFYGANRTGRWAGRLIQLQNLPQNHLTDLKAARDLIKAGDFEIIKLIYDNIPSILSQLIRTAFIAREGYTFAVADFSAIEARVIAWLAGEEWRLEVFRGHGKIYEASAAMMFNVPLESIGKGSDLRSKGKIAELALGYQGALGALKQMGGEKMGLSDDEMQNIVIKWREANPSIVRLWADMESCALRAVGSRLEIKSHFKDLLFYYDGLTLTITLPSGRKLFYFDPVITPNQWGRPSIKYKGMDQVTKQWTNVDTYGGKLVENIVQAIARDLLVDTMLRTDKHYDIAMHVHDEIVCEVPLGYAEHDLEVICNIMGQEVPWAPGLPLTADGYITPFYKKD